MSSIISILIISILFIRSALKGKEKKLSTKSFIILPVVMIYFIFDTFKNIQSIPTSYYLAFAVAILLGGLTGLYRSRFYSYKLNNEEVLYKRHPIDAFILVGILLFDAIIRYVFKTYESNLFVLINSSLVLLTASSILIRRILMFINYMKLKNSSVNFDFVK